MILVLLMPPPHSYVESRSGKVSGELSCATIILVVTYLLLYVEAGPKFSFERGQVVLHRVSERHSSPSVGVVDEDGIVELKREKRTNGSHIGGRSPSTMAARKDDSCTGLMHTERSLIRKWQSVQPFCFDVEITLPRAKDAELIIVTMTEDRRYLFHNVGDPGRPKARTVRGGFWSLMNI